MASETPVSTHSQPSEEVEKKEESEVKKVEAEDLPQPKGSVEVGADTKPAEEKTEDKPVRLMKTEAAPLVEPTEVKSEDKPVEPPPAEEVKRAEVAASWAEPKEDKPVEPPAAEDQKKTGVAPPPLAEDKQVEPPPAEDKIKTQVAELTEKKTEDKPIEPSIVEEKKREKAPIMESSDKDVSKEAVSGPAESKLVEKSEGEQRAEKVVEKPKVVQPEEPAKTSDVPPAGKAEELPAKVVEATEDKPEEPSESAAPAVKEKPSEHSKVVVQQIEKPPPTDMLAREEEISTGQVKAETLATQVEEKDVECHKVSEGSGPKEPAKETVGASEARGVELEKVEAQNEEKSVVPFEEKPTAPVTNSVPPPQLAEKAAARDVEPPAENKHKKDETLASVEAAVEKIGEGTTKEPEKTEQATEAKLEEEKPVDRITDETAPATESKLEEEKQVAKTDIQHSERAGDGEETKTTQDDPQDNAPAKTQKQSIVKMMKQSLVKAKKAIIGKSHNSVKDDGKK